MSNYFNFSSDRIDIFLILLDGSSSMEDDESNVRKGLTLFKESFNGFYLANSIVVSVCSFDDDFYRGDFRPVREMETGYSTRGRTALNYAIVKASEFLNDYVREVVRQTGVTPKVTFVCFSDGHPCGDRMYPDDGREAIKKMNYSGVTTAFAAFGGEINAQYGKDMGFMATIDVTKREDLLNFLGVELSNSCKEQSQSLKALGANFFSQAVEKSQSQEYSQTTAQALEDNSWIDEI